MYYNAIICTIVFGMQFDSIDPVRYPLYLFLINIINNKKIIMYFKNSNVHKHENDSKLITFH